MGQFFVGMVLLDEATPQKSEMDKFAELLVTELNNFKVQDKIEKVDSLRVLFQDAESAAQSHYDILDDVQLGALYGEFENTSGQIRNVLTPFMQYLQLVQAAPDAEGIPLDNWKNSDFAPPKTVPEEAGKPPWRNMSMFLEMLCGSASRYLMLMDLMATGMDINNKAALAKQCRQKKKHFADEMMLTGQKVWEVFKCWGFAFGPKNRDETMHKPDNTEADKFVMAMGKQCDLLMRLAQHAGAVGDWDARPYRRKGIAKFSPELVDSLY